VKSIDKLPVDLTDNNNNNSACPNNIASGGRSTEKVKLMLQAEVGSVKLDFWGGEGFL
jgi:hypothetical protein